MGGGGGGGGGGQHSPAILQMGGRAGAMRGEGEERGKRKSPAF